MTSAVTICLMGLEPMLPGPEPSALSPELKAHDMNFITANYYN